MKNQRNENRKFLAKIRQELAAGGSPVSASYSNRHPRMRTIKLICGTTPPKWKNRIKAICMANTFWPKAEVEMRNPAPDAAHYETRRYFCMFIRLPLPWKYINKYGR